MDLYDFFDAASGGDAHALDDFIARGVDVNSLSRAGWTALRYAVEDDRVPCVKLLIHAGADFMIHDGTRLTPLHRAAGLGHAECARLLLAAGAPPDPRDGIGRTPAMHALIGSNFEVLRLLFDAGCDLSIEAHGELTLFDYAQNDSWTDGDSRKEDFVRAEIERRALLSDTPAPLRSPITKSI